MRAVIRLRIGPVAFRIGADWNGPITQLRQLYANYPTPEDDFCDFTVRLEAGRPWRRWLRPAVHARGDHQLPGALPLPLKHGLLAAEMAMNLQVALGWRRHLLLHASSVERGGRAIIMCGESGSGKSTLALHLGETGWRFMGDEFSFVDLTGGTVNAFPRLISLKNAAIATTPPLRVPPGRLGPLLRGTPKGSVRHVVPPADAIARMDEPAFPALVLFPRYGEEKSVRRLGEAETFMRLTQASTNYLALGEAGFRALTWLVGRVPAFEIGYATGNEGSALAERLFTEATA